MRGLVLFAAIVASFGMGGARQVQPLTVDESLNCAGLYMLLSVLPANQFPGMVTSNRRKTNAFFDRARVLAERRGQATADHQARARAFGTSLAASYDAAGLDQIARDAVVNSWGPLDDRCEAGAALPV